MLIRRRQLVAAAGVAAFWQTLPGRANASSFDFDVVIYGGTLAGIMAGYAAARYGYSVALVIGPNPLGGMAANGLSAADLHITTYVGGLALAFYRRIGQVYGQTLTFYYEPHVAGAVAQGFVTDAELTTFVPPLAAVSKRGTQITSIRLTDGSVLNGRFFIDASYEGDLMAAAGVHYTWGREANAQYNEPLAGFDTGTQTGPYDAYDAGGNPLYGIVTKPGLPIGSADGAVMAYNFRLCVTNVSSNMRPYPSPPNYDASRYKLRLEQLTPRQQFKRPGASLPNGKFDVNGGGFMDSDFIGGNWGYPDGSPAQRQVIVQAQYEYHTGLLYFLANDPSVPISYRDTFAEFTLAADEFTDNAGWPRCTYVREARRLVGTHILIQSEVQRGASFSDAIGVGHASMDSHPTLRYPAVNGDTTLEGTFIDLPVKQYESLPYQIPYASLLPIADDATNLLVPVCMSSSRVAFCSLRYEHQYMIAGEAAGTAAALCLHDRTSAQTVSISALQNELLKHHGVLSNAR